MIWQGQVCAQIGSCLGVNIPEMDSAISSLPIYRPAKVNQNSLQIYPIKFLPCGCLRGMKIPVQRFPPLKSPIDEGIHFKGGIGGKYCMFLCLPDSQLEPMDNTGIYLHWNSVAVKKISLFHWCHVIYLFRIFKKSLHTCGYSLSSHVQSP